MPDTHPLLGNGASRHIKIYRETWPAIFRYNGRLYQEHYDVDNDVHSFVEISPEEAERWLQPKEFKDGSRPVGTD